MRASTLLVVVTLVSLSAFGAQARPNFVSFMPNGTKVDGHGCQNCHNSPAGGDARNPFGLAMAGSSFTWSTVCGQDSDGDGQTNGQELGDPDCVWTSGSAARDTAITNPGRATSVSTDPLGGSTNAALVVQPTCPDHSTSIVTGCLCDDGFSPSGATCAAATGVGTTWMCDPTWIGDSSCDCGCGSPDPDCADTAPATCQFNDCDSWQPTAGLAVDTTDTSKCAGGKVSSSPGGAVAGACPAHATVGASGGCLCDAGFSADASSSSCVGASGEGEGEGEGEGAAKPGCASTGSSAAPLGALALLTLALRRRQRRA